VLQSAVYNPLMRTVTLRPYARLPLSGAFVLVVNGAPPRGVSDVSGNFLDGSRRGKPGTNFVYLITRADAVGVPGTATAATSPIGLTAPRTGVTISRAVPQGPAVWG
jgi:hypothetical protein